ncbi:MAG TPA: 2-dehydropantoate 2-reductase [Hyphomicrobiaceae bacterium]|nr:2-dehydropantoate 2-reductase [Hyphomicrobiaceae bacterium]
MRILIVGAGAIGGWLAGVLARGGAEVALLARGVTLAALRDGGLTLIEGDRRSVVKLPASDNAADLPRPDAVVLAVKTYGFAGAVAAASPALRHGPMLVTAMNGLPWWFLDGLDGPLDGIRLESVDPGGRGAALLADVRPVGAVVHASTRAEAPGVVRVVGTDRLILGEPRGEPGNGPSACLAELARLAAAGGIHCPVTPQIRTEIWAKLWGNASMNPVSAIARRSAQGIFGDARLTQLLHTLMQEFERVGRRIGLALPMSVDERLAVTQKLGDFRTSMLGDAEAGRPLEVEGLLGVVVELAERLGEPVPATHAVYALARAVGPCPGGVDTASPGLQQGISADG